VNAGRGKVLENPFIPALARQSLVLRGDRPAMRKSSLRRGLFRAGGVAYIKCWDAERYLI